MSPDGKVSREQALVILCRALGYDTSIADESALNRLTDASDLSLWARPAVAVMAAKGYRNLAILEDPPPDDRPGWQEFRDLLLPRRAELMGYLDRLKMLQPVMRSKAGNMVICHADLHGGNLLLSQNGGHSLGWGDAEGHVGDRAGD